MAPKLKGTPSRVQGKKKPLKPHGRTLNPQPSAHVSLGPVLVSGFGMFGAVNPKPGFRGLGAWGLGRGAWGLGGVGFTV